MKHFVSRFLCLTAILLLMMSLSLQAANLSGGERNGNIRPVKASRDILAYSFAEEQAAWGSRQSTQTGQFPLGNLTVSSASTSPGQTVGWTWYDYQQNCGMGRMVETGPHSGQTGPTTVHFGWMHLPDSVYDGRTYMYNAYISGDGSYAGAFRLHDYTKYSGYVNIDVTPDNRAAVGGHCDEKGPIPYQAHIHFDACSACKLFDAYVRVPDSLAGYDQLNDQEAMWPRFLLQFGTDTVLHIVTRNWDMVGAIMYFRKVGYEGSPDAVWDYPPYVVDTIETSGRDLNGQRIGDRVAMAWLATPPYQEPDCDTCSGLATLYDGLLVGQMDNDIYVQVSNDQGQNWEPRQNVTQIPIGEAAYKAYCDLSLMFDQASNLHVIWQGVPWPADECIWEEASCLPNFFIDPARIFHWSENVPYVRTICDHTYEPSDSCGPPRFWSTQVAKMSISECDGKLYTIWSQFNDIPNGVDDDCAQWVYEAGTWSAGANADIWVSVSGDGGMTWDAQRNLTNSYTPRCDPWGGENCQSDYYASMSRWGKQLQTGEDWSGAEVVDPSGGTSPTDWYLDIQYVNDLDAGAIIWEDRPEGTWTNNPVKWFRMPCIEPVPNPLFIAEWTRYGDPNYNKPGEERLVDLDFENAGNVALEYSLSVVEDNGPTGWLSYQNFSGIIPSGLGNIETGEVILNVGGAISTTGNYFGRLHVTGNDPINLPADIEIELIVADTICPVIHDVVNTNLISLSVSNHGNMGRNGAGRMNMDFYPEDCDTTATVYLFEGSVFIGRIIGGDTVMNYSIFNVDFTDDAGFRPQCGEVQTSFCSALNAEVFYTGVFTTSDSAIALEKYYIAPLEDVSYILEILNVWSFDGATHSDVMIGEAWDWDVPWDFLEDDVDLNITAVNTGGTEGTRNLLYQQGYDAYGANVDTGYPYNCQYNDERFAGSFFIESYLDGSLHAPVPWGGFIGENDSLVYPADEGFVVNPFYEECEVSGLRGSDSTEDLHAAIDFFPAITLAPTGGYTVFVASFTTQQGTYEEMLLDADAAKSYFYDFGGASAFADADHNGMIDICETCCQIMGDFQNDADLDPLDAVSFVNWMWRGGAGPACADACDVNCSGGDPNPMDAVYLVNYFWRGGAAPCDCSELP